MPLWVDPSTAPFPHNSYWKKYQVLLTRFQINLTTYFVFVFQYKWQPTGCSLLASSLYHKQGRKSSKFSNPLVKPPEVILLSFQKIFPQPQKEKTILVLSSDLALYRHKNPTKITENKAKYLT